MNARVPGQRRAKSSNASPRPDNLQAVNDVLTNSFAYKNGDQAHPIFCFRHLHPHFNTQQKGLTARDKANLLDRIANLSGMSWSDIKQSPRHQYGFELIKVKQLKPKLPQVMPGAPDEHGDYDKIWVFRRDGKKHVFAGVRIGAVFHLVFIEAKFGDLYEHD